MQDTYNTIFPRSCSDDYTVICLLGPAKKMLVVNLIKDMLYPTHSSKNPSAFHCIGEDET
jgi:hypothetical protein